MDIIGIAGKMGCGKSVLMEHMSCSLFDCAELNFGDLLKQEVSTKFNFPLSLCYDQKGKETIINVEKFQTKYDIPPAMTVRYILQWYGTDYIRTKDQDYWVNLMCRTVKDLEKTQIRNIIIGDIRFVNEADYVIDNGGKVIQLLPYNGWDSHSDHESENALDDYKKFWMSIAPPYGTLEETAEYIMEII